MNPLKPQTLSGLGTVTALLLAAVGASAQTGNGHESKPAPAPTPRLADGTVDLGGDGIWNQPWITDFGKALVGGADAKIPFLPWTKAMFDYNAATKVAYDPEGFCLPPGSRASPCASPLPHRSGSTQFGGNQIHSSRVAPVPRMVSQNALQRTPKAEGAIVHLDRSRRGDIVSWRTTTDDNN